MEVIMAWEYYFEPVSDLSYNEGDSLNKEYGAPDGSAFEYIFPDQLTRKKANEIIQKYIKLNQMCRKK